MNTESASRLNAATLQAASRLLQDSVFHFRGQPVGTVAAKDDSPAAANYQECFVRDFFVSATVFLADGQTDIVRNFLSTIVDLRSQEKTWAGHERQPGVMPASFHVGVDERGDLKLIADFGERAIGRVAPVDSMMWWVILLHCYVCMTGDRAFVETEDVQSTIHSILEFCLRDGFEVFPTLLVPDGSCMIDRRLGVYGHPLEIQSLFYGMLHAARGMLRNNAQNKPLIQKALERQRALRTYVRIFYWLDMERLNEIHRFDTEQFGTGSVNMLNIYPESIPDWVGNWLADDTGYLVGNLGPSRMDFRIFTLGNLLAILFDLATGEQAFRIMDLFEARWDDLIGNMPLKICYPALEGEHWRLQTGSDPKNVPWSYHNGGNWPVLLWAFVAAAVKTGRHELARRAYAVADSRLLRDQWPEYYDGKNGRLIGRRANFNQVWSAAALIFSRKILDDANILSMFPGQPTSIRCIADREV